MEKKAPEQAYRILYLVGQLRCGGLERQLCYLLSAMDRKRYKPAVVVWNFSSSDIYADKIKSLGIEIFQMPSGVSRIEKLQCFCRLTKELNPEVIQSYSFFVNFAAYWAARGTKAVALGAIRSDFVREKSESGLILGSLSARWPRFQIANSFSAAENARQCRSLFSPRQIDVVRNGLDLKRFSNSNSPNNGKAYIVGVGSLFSVKRWDRLLRIAEMVKRKGGKFVLRIVGDGPERGLLEGQAHDLGISECVEFVGLILDVPKALEQSRFLVHTSDVEGSPNSVMEAMACGRAVVAMDAGDIPFLVEHGTTGFVVSRGDEATFADYILRLLGDYTLCCCMGTAARVKAEREFGLERLVEETLNAYKKAGWREERCVTPGIGSS